MVDLLNRFDQLTNPFDQSTDPTHVTGSAIVIDRRREHVLLLKHKRLGIWLQPGGHMEPGEWPADTARREAVEETGLELELVDRDLIHVDVHDGGGGHTHLDLRYLAWPKRGTDTTPRPPAGESQQVEWLMWPEAIERASDDRLTALLRHLSPDDHP